MDIETAYTIIKKARLMIKNTDPSYKTIEEYERIFYLATSGRTTSPSAKIEACTSKSVVTKIKSACRHIIGEDIKNQLRAQDKIQRSGQTPDWFECVENISRAVDEYEKIGLMQPKSILKRRSKRQDIKGMADGWQNVLIDQVQKKDRTAALICAMTGCRPAELAKGVKVVVSEDSITVTIMGAKISETSGQPVRTLTYAITAKSLVQRLARRLSQGENVVKIDDPRRFSTSIRDAGKRAFPDLRRTLTPYCFRHQVASNLKASTLSSDDVSKSLGHCSDKTTVRYGHTKLSSGGVVPSQVVANRDVRHKAERALDRAKWQCPEISDPDLLTSFTQANHREF